MDKPTEFGKMVTIQEAEGGLVTAYEVQGRRQWDSIRLTRFPKNLSELTTKSTRRGSLPHPSRVIGDRGPAIRFGALLSEEELETAEERLRQAEAIGRSSAEVQ